MSIKSVATSILTAAFLAGSAAVSCAQTTSPTGGRTATPAPKQGTTAPSAGAQKGAVDCPGNAENSKGKAAQHNPNCVKTNTKR